jgi:DNA-binding MarR family transcriptional regulator
MEKMDYESQPVTFHSTETSPFAESILLSLRRIIRAIDLHSREVEARFQLTVPQLVCLRQMAAEGSCTPSDLSRAVFLSQATVTGILNRMEDRGLILRKRSREDRRRVSLVLTEEGRRILETAPLPLQDRFSERLAALAEPEQRHIDTVLKQVVDMMEAPELDDVPIMTTDVFTS